MLLAVLRNQEAILQNQQILMSDMARIKAVLIKRIGDDERENFAEYKRFETSDEFEEFCSKLEDRNERVMFVSVYYVSVLKYLK